MTGDISPLPDRPAPERLRASHEDRDRVIELLRVAAGDGRLTAEELDERIEIAFSARTYGELALLTADLPVVGQPVAALAASPSAKNVVRIDCRSGNARRDGRWVVPRRIEVRVTSGGVKLDFTQAVFEQRALEIDAEVRSGSLRLITRPGVVVDADDVVVRSGNVRVKAPWGSDVRPELTVTISGKVGSGTIVARPPRRTFWQWLTRRPLRYAITR
ncbi:MAG TPA: DUF1707 domain-containing protein [Streptosporangiaceae bacterium]|nr:DUF1707 domain-containing protein [Streptosporangiaceae bacterium]